MLLLLTQNSYCTKTIRATAAQKGKALIIAKARNAQSESHNKQISSKLEQTNQFILPLQKQNIQVGSK